jgi:hypothetical protein
MADTEPTAELNEGFSEPDATAPPWAEVAEVLSASEMFWFSTVRSDRPPPVTPVPAIWLDSALHLCAGCLEQKTTNLEANPQCILTTGTNELRSGLDVVRDVQPDARSLHRLRNLRRCGPSGHRAGSQSRFGE